MDVKNQSASSLGFCQAPAKKVQKANRVYQNLGV
jgi:hypothetical protein